MAATTQDSANPCGQFCERKCFRYQVVRSGIQAPGAFVHTLKRSKKDPWQFEFLRANVAQCIDTGCAWQRQIEQCQVARTCHWQSFFARNWKRSNFPWSRFQEPVRLRTWSLNDNMSR